VARTHHDPPPSSRDGTAGTPDAVPAAALIVNTHSRRGRHHYARAKRLLARRRVRVDASYPMRDPGRLPEAVRHALTAGVRLIIVGGGDGTLSAVVDELAYRDAVLGILPLGTANSFARTLDIPLEIDRAVEVIAGGETAGVDLGRIGDDYFANTAALGLAATLARSRLTGLKHYFGAASYPLAGVVKFLGHRSFRCTLSHHGRRTSYDALDVLIANGRYQGGALVAPDASVASRALVVRIVKGPAKRNLIWAWALRAAGRAPGARLVETVHAASVTIETEPPLPVSIDGEAVARTPVRASVAPDALKVRVPRGFAARHAPPPGHERNAGDRGSSNGAS